MTFGGEIKRMEITLYPCTVRSQSHSIKWVMTVETNAVGLQHIWRNFE
jgi:hypothetical protein